VDVSTPKSIAVVLVKGRSSHKVIGLHIRAGLQAQWLLDEVENSGNPDLQEIVKRNGGRFFRNAPTVIIVSTEKKHRFGVINASAATENMLIASKSLGIGSCWIGSVEMLSASKHVDFFAKELQLPDGFTPQFGITLGYGEGASPPVPERKRNLVSYIS
jgi:nitroreductase